MQVKVFIPILTFLGGLALWQLGPQYHGALYFQSKAIFALSLSLTLFSCLLLSLSPRLMEMIKILAYLLLSLTFLLSLEPFYLTFLDGKKVYLKLRRSYPLDEAVFKTFSWLDFRLTSRAMAYITWSGNSCFSLFLIVSLFRILVLVPGRRLFLDRAYRVKEGPWNAGFLEKAKENQLLKNKKGLPLGVPIHKSGSRGKILRYFPNPKTGWLGGHHVVISGSQGGKGVSCVLPAILDHHGPVAVLDIKGELFAMTKRAREKQGRTVVVLNPFDVVKKNEWCWNPLDYIRPQEFQRDSQTIIEGLLEPPNQYNEHFYKMAFDILQVSLEVIQHTLPKHAFNLNTLYDFICGPGFIKRLKQWESQEDFLEGRPAKMAHILLAAGDEERGSFLTTLKRNLSWIGFEKTKVFLTPQNEELKESSPNELPLKDLPLKGFSLKEFSFEDLLDNKIDIFCVIPLDMIEAMSGFLRLFTNVVLGTVIRQSGYKNPQEKILLLLDEFPRLGAMRQLINIVTVAAGAGIEAFMVAQDKSSIESVWGKEADVIFGSSATVRVFNLGRTDTATASWVSSLMGDRTVVTRTNATREYGQFLHGAGSESVSQMKEKLMTTAEIQEMSQSKILCFLRGQKPLLLERIISHEHPLYRGRLDPNPTLLGHG